MQKPKHSRVCLETVYFQKYWNFSAFATRYHILILRLFEKLLDWDSQWGCTDGIVFMVNGPYPLSYSLLSIHLLHITMNQKKKLRAIRVFEVLKTWIKLNDIIYKPVIIYY